MGLIDKMKLLDYLNSLVPSVTDVANSDVSKAVFDTLMACISKVKNGELDLLTATVTLTPDGKNQVA